MGKKYVIDIPEGEVWWGGLIDDGVLMPFGEVTHTRDLHSDFQGNQAVPLLISNKGRYVWSEEHYTYTFSNGKLLIEAESGEIDMGEGYADLKNAYRAVCKKYFPPSGKIPDQLLFTAPQYNLWIELLYDPTEDKVLQYAQSVIAHGMPPGVIMIDDNWQYYYGSWEFHAARFHNPKEMVNTLHQKGFKVMLWVCPFITPDTVTYRMLRDQDFLLRDKTGKVAVREWWNGHGAILDCTNPEAVAWVQGQLDRLIQEIGIDGFKFDAGDPSFYEDDDICKVPTTRNGHCEAWGRVGLKYPLNEYRACWKLAGQNLVQRLRDKNHAWEGNGLDTLIPNGLAQGLAGYAYNCPDMIGGGQYLNFMENVEILDAELFVRYAQCSALFPMMQFSAAPWRVLDKEQLSYCVEAAKLHLKMGRYILELAEHAALTGEPIMRHMAYVYPEGGYEKINDQFMLGEDILVAPVVQKGVSKRKVVFPIGKWAGDDGSVVDGPVTLEVDTPLERLPWFRRED